MCLVNDDNYCIFITNHLEYNKFLTKKSNSYEEMCLENSNDPNDLQVKDATLKLEKEIKSPIHELKEKTWELKNIHQIFNTCLLNEFEFNDFVSLHLEFKNYFA